jgi:signal peptidase
MNPMLQAGDLVLTVDVAPEEIAVGDIIRFRSGEVDILHRVVEIRNAGGLEFITRGDANNVNDPPLPASAVEGRVVRILPGLGWPSIGIRLGLQWVLDRVAS